MRRRDNTTGGTQARWDPHVRFLALCSPETAPLCPVSVGPSGKTFDVRVNARTVGSQASSSRHPVKSR